MKKDITVLDFFAGCGTTLEAVYNLNQKDGGNRKCILVQKPEKIEDKNCPYKNIAELCIQRCKAVCKNDIEIFDLKNS